MVTKTALLSFRIFLAAVFFLQVHTYSQTTNNSLTLSPSEYTGRIKRTFDQNLSAVTGIKDQIRQAFSHPIQLQGVNSIFYFQSDNSSLWRGNYYSNQLQSTSSWSIAGIPVQLEMNV